MALPIPDWFALDAVTIAGDSRLKSHYLNPAATEADFLGDIERLIPIACAFVKTGMRPALGNYKFPFTLEQFAQAYPDESSTEHAEKRNDQNALASEAVKERIIYDLYRMLDGTDNQTIANGCEKAANALIASLCSEIKDTASALKEAGKPNRGAYGSLSFGRRRCADPLLEALREICEL